MSSRAHATLRNQWQLILAVAQSRRGLTMAQLQQAVEVSRATVYRYLDSLREAGVALETYSVNGEARVRLWGEGLPPLGPTTLQLAALRIARSALAAFDGAQLVAELDELMRKYAIPTPSNGLTLGPKRARPHAVVPALDRAIRLQRRARIRYRSVEASRATWRTVDPLGLHLAKGSLYFLAFDHRRATVVTFKVDRIRVVDVLADKADRHPDIDVAELFSRSSKVWTGDRQRVRVRIHSEASRFVHEYPLVPDQTIVDEPGGGVVVEADVNGLMEAKRWVLSWGKAAEALEPEALRAAVADEVLGAAARYRAPSQSRAIKPIARSRRLADRETGPS